MRGRLSRIRLAPLVASVVLFYFVSQVTGKTLAEWRGWDEISRNPVEIDAAVINRMAALSNSGKITKYDITYEFVAPAAAGGSDYSRAALGAVLEDKFFKKPDGGGGDGRRMPTSRGDGNQYFSKTQAVDPEFANGRSGAGTVRVVYAKNDPRNSLIKETGGYPMLMALLIGVLLIIGGCLMFLGLSRALRPAK